MSIKYQSKTIKQQILAQSNIRKLKTIWQTTKDDKMKNKTAEFKKKTLFKKQGNIRKLKTIWQNIKDN